jgi:hypothetical protein
MLYILYVNYLKLDGTESSKFEGKAVFDKKLEEAKERDRRKLKSKMKVDEVTTFDYNTALYIHTITQQSCQTMIWPS